MLITATKTQRQV